MTVLFLCRHPETNASKADRYYTDKDSGFTTDGWAQLEQMQRFFSSVDLSAVYTSPLDRCVKTAEAIGKQHHLVPAVRPGLTEWFAGDWTGFTRVEVSSRFGSEYSLWESDPAGRRPFGGESGYEVAARAVNELLDILKHHDGNTICVVAHHTVNRIALAHFKHLPIRDYRSLSVAEGSIIEFRFRGENLQLESTLHVSPTVQ